jgi:hypothetical protein
MLLPPPGGPTHSAQEIRRQLRDVAVIDSFAGHPCEGSQLLPEMALYLLLVCISSTWWCWQAPGVTFRLWFPLAGQALARRFRYIKGRPELKGPRPELTEPRFLTRASFLA